MYIIMYHYVRKIIGSKYPNIKGLELIDFKKQIEWLYVNGFQFVTLDDLINKENITDKSVLLTFDDGYSDHYQVVFPFLKKCGIQGVFSVPGKLIREKKILDVNKIHFILASANIEIILNRLFAKMNYYRGKEFTFALNKELYNRFAIANRFDDKDTIFVKRILQVELPKKVRSLIVNELFSELVTDEETKFADELYMSWDNIQTMSQNGMCFGIHGYDHFWMNRLTEAELRNDLNQALDVFDGIIDLKNWCICYPYGSYNDLVIQISKEMGATSGMGTNVAQYCCEQDDIFKLPRLDTNDFPPRSNNYKQL